MAILAPSPLKPKSYVWASGDSADKSSDEPAPACMGIMAYQYPPPPSQSGTEMDISPSTGTRPQPSQPAQDTQEARETQDLPPPPQLANTSEQGSMGGDKKRSKLGYHRTSIACGHCRRRKIRCVPSATDAQGRCINCIRLKKECTFLPVDQQQSPDSARKSTTSRSSVGPKIASSSSSPAMQAGLPSELQGQPSYHLAIPSIQTMSTPVKPEAFSSDSNMPPSASSSRQYDYSHQGMTNWMAETSPSNTTKASDLAWRSYPGESPITPAFSPYSTHAPHSDVAWTATGGGESSSREDVAWSPYPSSSARAVTYGLGPKGNQPQHQYAPTSHVSGRPYDRKAVSLSSDIYSRTMPGVESMPMPGTTLDHGVCLSAGGAVPPPPYGPWQQSYPYSKPAAEGYGGWYGEAEAQQPPEPPQQDDDTGHSGSNVYYHQPSSGR